MFRCQKPFLFAAFLGALASSASAQSQTTQVQTALNSEIATIAGEIVRAKATNPRATLPPGEIDLFALRGLQQGSLVRLLQDYEEHRSDEQVGATSSSSGTTTLVSKGTVPEILAFAVENGAITRSQSGTTLTFRGNLGGLFDTLADKGFIQTVSHGNDPAHDLLKRLSFSTSFDASRGAAIGATTTAFTGDQQQLSQWSFRAQIVNRRDPMRAEFQQRWQALTAGPQAALAQASGAAYAALSADPAFQSWLNDARTAIADAGAADVPSTLSAQMSKFPVGSLKPATQRALGDYDRTATAFVRGRQQVLDDIAAGAQVAFEYTNDRSVHGPNLSNYRLVGALGGSADLTGNVSVTLFDKIPVTATHRVRDFQLSGELDVKLGSVETTGPFVLALSGKYLHQFENSFDDAGMVILNTIGTTAIGQVKLTIPVKGSGTKIPLSVTFANRTDLIKESIVRGNVGLTYDLDTLFAKFKP